MRGAGPQSVRADTHAGARDASGASTRQPHNVGRDEDRAAQRPGRRDRAGAPGAPQGAGDERDRAAQRPGRRDRAGAPIGAEPSERSERPAPEGK